MDNNFWKPFLTLFGIGAAISLARSLKSKKNIGEIVSEIIISGFLATGAAIVQIFYPTVSFVVIAGIASLLAILGVSFLSDKLESIINAAISKYTPTPKDTPKDDNGPKL
jgi:hypothetical protein